MRLLAILAFCAALGAHAAENRLEGDALYHGDLNLWVTKPGEWRFLTAKEKRAARSATPFKASEYAMQLRQNPFPPRIVIAKYPEPRADLNPRVEIDRYPLDDARFRNVTWVANRILINHQAMLKSPKVVDPVRWVLLGGQQAGYFRIHFTLAVKKGADHHVDLRVWVVRAGLMYLVVAAHTAQSGSDTSGPEIDGIVGSIRVQAR
jgi:hypothetical protein